MKTTTVKLVVRPKDVKLVEDATAETIAAWIEANWNEDDWNGAPADIPAKIRRGDWRR